MWIYFGFCLFKVSLFWYELSHFHAIHLICLVKTSNLSSSRSLDTDVPRTVTVMWSHACWSCTDRVCTSPPFLLFFLWTWLYYTMNALFSLITFEDLFVKSVKNSTFVTLCLYKFTVTMKPKHFTGFFYPVGEMTLWNKTTLYSILIYKILTRWASGYLV